MDATFRGKLLKILVIFRKIWLLFPFSADFRFSVIFQLLSSQKRLSAPMWGFYLYSKFSSFWIMA